MGSVLHITFRFTIGETIRAIRPEDAVLECADLLLTGPSAFDLDRHVPLRAAYWGAKFRPAAEVRDLLAQSSSVMVWIDSAQGDDLALCHGLHLIHHYAPPASDCYAVRGQPTKESRGPLERVPRSVRRSATTLWRAFTARSPLAFQRASQAGVGLAPRMMPVTRARAALFPREVSGALRLSAVDEALLRGVQAHEQEDATPVTAFVHALGVRGLESVLQRAGDIYVAKRIQALCTHRVPLLVGSEHPGPPMLRRRHLRLTEAGRSALDAGLSRFDDAPVLITGGAVAYDPAECWVAVPRGEGYRLRRSG